VFKIVSEASRFVCIAGSRLAGGQCCRLVLSGFRDFPLSGFPEILVSWFREKACGRWPMSIPPKLHNAAPHRLLPENEISSYRI
jgi:hypothetical protein